ncbi:DUF397 domain-containing protein [Streptomyces sp. NPDC060194]|uniref:DUF397 domain-containing protein n=1 Tax=Streptomyces sp. NPDC060194 TaxID=3347069 RepID=UPI0036624BC0
MKQVSIPDYDLTDAVWKKSSYSGGDGGDCVEVATWRKSSHSSGDGGNCLEVSDDLAAAGIVPVRDSKTPHGPHLAFRTGPWTTFVTALKTT